MSVSGVEDLVRMRDARHCERALHCQDCRTGPLVRDESEAIARGDSLNSEPGSGERFIRVAVEVVVYEGGSPD